MIRNDPSKWGGPPELASRASNDAPQTRALRAGGAGRSLANVVAVAVLVLAAGCDLNKPPDGKRSIGAVAGCDPQAIDFYGAKYRSQLVFDACGINNFKVQRWSPDGNRLFFQTPAGPFILDGKTRGIEVLPVASPHDTPIWLTNTQLAYGVVPKNAADAHRIDFWDTKSRVNSIHNLKGYRNPRLFQVSGRPGIFYFVADTSARKGGVYQFSLPAKGKIVPAFEWMRDSVTSFAFHPDAKLVTYSVEGGGEVVIARSTNGKRMGSFPSANRATISSDARWVLVEETGTPRRLDSAKNGGTRSTLPAMSPQRLYLWDLKTKKRVEFPGVWGRQAEWYPGFPQVSVILQGFEEHLYNPNVVLVNVEMLLRDAEMRRRSSQKP